MCVGVGVVLGFTNSFFGVLVCMLGSFVVLNLLVVLSPFLLYMYTHVCVCVFSVFFLSSENMFGY